jgi:Uma2 family endonuclease
MARPAGYWTADMVRALPEDGTRYEVVYGELLVTPAPAVPHQVVIRRLMLGLAEYLEPLGLGHTLFFSPADISWGPDTLVQPDLFVMAPTDVSEKWTTFKSLRLAVEVLSPSSRRSDRVVKRKLYQERGVATYWIVDPDARLVEAWTPASLVAAQVRDELRWRVEAAAPELVIPVGRLFAPVDQP